MLPTMDKHRWAEWIEQQEVVAFLWRSKDRLERAWEADRQAPTGYPINIFHALNEIQHRLAMKRPRTSRPIHIPEPIKPKTLAELVPEKVVKAVWEDQHSGTFEDAISKSVPNNFEEHLKSWRIFQGIVRAVEGAYGVNVFGLEVLPRPKVSVLHRGLLEIANAAGLRDLTTAGLTEFFDDLCPCGIKNHKEAIRKLSSRSGRIRRQKH